MNLRYNVPTFVFRIYRINCQRFATLELNLKSAYTGFWLFRVQFIQDFGLFRIPAYSGHGLNSILVYSGFCFDSILAFYAGFRETGFTVILQEFTIFYFKNTCTGICSNLPVVLFYYTCTKAVYDTWCPCCFILIYMYNSCLWHLMSLLFYFNIHVQQLFMTLDVTFFFLNLYLFYISSSVTLFLPCDIYSHV